MPIASLRNLRINMKFFSITRSLLLIYSLFFGSTFYAEIARDLELNAVFTAINHTQSSHGEYALRSLLAQPIADQHTLQGRQTIIAHIARNSQLHTQLDRLLKAFAQQEPVFERVMHPASDVETAALTEFYFSSPYFAEWNYSPLGLELGQVAHFCNLCSSMVQHALSFAIFTWALDEEHVCASHPAKEDSLKQAKEDSHKHEENTHEHKKHDHDSAKKEHSDKHKNHSHKQKDGAKSDKPDHHTAKGTCSEKHVHSPTCNPKHHHDSAIVSSMKSLARSPEFRYVFQVWHGVAQLQELYSIQAIVRNNMKCIKELQTQLMGIARGIRIINHIHSTLKDHPEVTTHLVHYSALEKIATTQNISEKLSMLLKLLNSATFMGEPSVLSRVGVILAAYKLIQEIGYELEPALAAVGEIDAYTSCADLLNNSQSNSTRYSFAQYNTTNTTPMLHAHNFWHPLVATDSIELNSIALGVNNSARNIILTGPNACGKSTNLKALTLCAYLAQTITLVPAEQYSQTLCKEIYSSIVVSDNIQQNKSLFVAELADAEELLTRVENLESGEYMLIVLDELFKSTHHQKGQNVAYRLLEQLYASSNVITIVSTHFEKLIELADKNSDCCANYTVDNFKLKPGIGLADNAFDIVGKKTRSRLLQ